MNSYIVQEDYYQSFLRLHEIFKSLSAAFLEVASLKLQNLEFSS